MNDVSPSAVDRLRSVLRTRIHEDDESDRVLTEVLQLAEQIREDRNYSLVRQAYLRLRHIVCLDGDDSVRLLEPGVRYAGVSTRVLELQKQLQRKRQKLVVPLQQASLFPVVDLPVSMLVGDPRTCGSLVHAQVQRHMLAEDGALNPFLDGSMGAVQRDGNRLLIARVICAALRGHGLYGVAVEFVALFDRRTDDGSPRRYLRGKAAADSASIATHHTVRGADAAAGATAGAVVGVPEHAPLNMHCRRGAGAVDEETERKRDGGEHGAEDDAEARVRLAASLPLPLDSPPLRDDADADTDTDTVTDADADTDTDAVLDDATWCSLPESMLFMEPPSLHGPLPPLADAYMSPEAARSASPTPPPASLVSALPGVPLSAAHCEPPPAEPRTPAAADVAAPEVTVAKIDLLLETAQRALVVCELKLSPAAGSQCWHNPSSVLQLVLNGYLLERSTGLRVSHLLLVEAFRSEAAHVQTEELLLSSVVPQLDALRPLLPAVLGCSNPPGFAEYVHGLRVLPLAAPEARQRTEALIRAALVADARVSRPQRTLREFIAHAQPAASVSADGASGTEQREGAVLSVGDVALLSVAPLLPHRRAKQQLQQRQQQQQQHARQSRAPATPSQSTRSGRPPPLPAALALPSADRAATPSSSRLARTPLAVAFARMASAGSAAGSPAAAAPAALAAPRCLVIDVFNSDEENDDRAGAAAAAMDNEASLRSVDRHSPPAVHSPPPSTPNRRTPALAAPAVAAGGGGGGGAGVLLARAGVCDSPSTPNTPTQKVRVRVPWSAAETAALRQGVVELGLGHWEAILARYRTVFHPKRTSTDLKDKHRNELLKLRRQAVQSASVGVPGVTGKLDFEADDM